MSLIPDHVERRMRTLRARGHETWCSRVFTMRTLKMPIEDFVGVGLSLDGVESVHCSTLADTPKLIAPEWHPISMPNVGPFVLLAVLEGCEMFTAVHTIRFSQSGGNQ